MLFLALLRVGIGGLFRVAPRLGEAAAARLFLTPRNRGSRREPRLDGHAVERRVRTVAGHDVVSWTWGSGPDVLLVHGWEGRATQLETIAAPLVAAGFRVTTFDLPAHGLSSGRWTTLVHCAQAVGALAEERGGVHAVIGHSLGASAATLALLDMPFAERAVLLAPAVDPRPFSRAVAEMLGVPARNVEGMERAIERRAGRPLDEIDLGRRAGALELPMLVLHDVGDREVPYRHGEMVSRVSRRGVLEPRLGLGHRRILRDPGVVERIVEFITQEDVLTASEGARERLEWTVQ